MIKRFRLIFALVAVLIGLTSYSLWLEAQARQRFASIIVGGREAAWVQGIWRGSVSVDFAGVATITCNTDATTFTVAGAAIGDSVVASPRANLATGAGLGACFVNAADTVSCILCNPTAGASNPAAQTLDVVVIRHAAQ